MDNSLQSLSPKLSQEKMREFVLSEVLDNTQPINYIIASARGGPRSLEWLFGNLHSLPVPIITERAIPFIANELEGSNIYLFDDSLIFGSTLYDIKQRLLRQNVNVKVSALVVDDYWFRGRGVSPWNENEASPSKFKKKLRPFRAYCSLPTQLISPYHRLLLRSFRNLGKPYTVDFPMLTVQLPMNVSDWLESAWEYHIKSVTGACPFCLTPTLNGSGNFQAFSIQANTEVLIKSLFTKVNGVELEGQTKFRFHISAEKNIARLTPMLILRVFRDNFTAEFRDPFLQDCWQYLKSILNANKFDKEVEDDVAMFRAFTFIACLGAGLIAWPLISKGLSENDRIIPELSFDDTSLLFGHNIAQTLTNKFNEAVMSPQSAHQKSDVFISTPKSSKSKSFNTKFDNEALKERLEKWIAAKDQPEEWRVDPSMTVTENLQKIFIALRDIADESRRPEAEDSNRLKEGFSFSDLMRLLVQGGLRPNKLALSFNIDYLVDIGVIVPLVASCGNQITKAYRSGERVDAEQFASTLHKCIFEWQEETGEEGLSDVALAKVCVLLRRLWPNSVPFPPGQHLHGASLFDGEKDVVRWALRHKVVMRQEVFNVKGIK